ncbi:hypothetical protein [Streptomyces sp. MI02-7b]|uniref:hypothetical protein n=1 Tax=Streptomyces sp. MI02-7b TaxID=462941 RepID=UPI0029C9E15F|nr:hypothetical protein [Streptomyces sp. MI02-7b]
MPTNTEGDSVATVQCPPGTTVTGGGFTFLTGPSVPVRSSDLIGNGWTVIVPGSDQPSTFVASAVCAG